MLVCLPFDHCKHLLYSVLRQLASLISLMDPFHFPILSVIHKFRTRNYNIQALLPKHAAGETHCLGGFTHQQHFVRKLEENLFGNEQNCLLGYNVNTGKHGVSKTLVQNSGLSSQHQNNENTSYEHSLHTSIRFIQAYASYQHTLHTNKHFIPTYTSYQYTLHTTKHFIQTYTSHQ